MARAASGTRAVSGLGVGNVSSPVRSEGGEACVEFEALTSDRGIRSGHCVVSVRNVHMVPKGPARGSRRSSRRYSRRRRRGGARGELSSTFRNALSYRTRPYRPRQALHGSGAGVLVSPSSTPPDDADGEGSEDREEERGIRPHTVIGIMRIVLNPGSHRPIVVSPTKQISSNPYVA